MVETRGVVMTAEKAAEYAGGRLYGPAGAAVSGFESDSRKCAPGLVFVAMAGERTDGHNYISAAFESGACGALVDASRADRLEEQLPEGRFFIYCDDPLKGLQKIAAGYMKTLSRPVRIGITGSNGKTTTKELTASVLSEKYSVISTEGNYNSEIGLPQTVFRINDGHDYAVIEMGINRMGEMEVLADILRPDIVVITNIGSAHIGIFNTVETIAAEKGKAVSFFDGSGTLFLDEDEAFRELLTRELQGSVQDYGERSLAASAGFEAESLGLGGWKVTLGRGEAECSFIFPLVGVHNLKNAICAASVGLFCGLATSEIAAGLQKSVPVFGRGEIIEGPVTVIQDCYNANLESMLGALDFTDDLKWPGNRIYVLGDMKELGDSSTAVHAAVGRAAGRGNADWVLFLGRDSALAFSEAENIVSESGRGPKLFLAEEMEQLEEKMLEILEEGDLVLLKASRTMNLERLTAPALAKFRGEKC